MNLRGLLMMGVIGVMFPVADLIGRTLIVAIIKVRPSLRQRVLDAWLYGLTDFALWGIRCVGGAHFEINARVPFESGVLVVMNHQSLLDIPIALKSVTGGYPMIVARDRYRSGIPLISFMLRLYGHPTVRPGEGGPEQIERLSRLAERTDRPVLIFPEGSRSRDGNIKPFRTSGLKAMLAVRDWKVYIIVLDGLWRATGLSGFMRNVSSLRVRAESLGPFDYRKDIDDPDPFLEDIERRMRVELAEMRGSRRPDAAAGVEEK